MTARRAPALACSIAAAFLSTLAAGGPGAAAEPLVPVNTSPPSISGKPQPGLIVKASPGSWTNEPGRYRYIWEACDANGEGCVETGRGRGHLVSRANLGHTLRVVVTGVNDAGEGAPATSAPTRLVEGPPVHRYLGESTHRLTIEASDGYLIKVHSYINHLYHRITLQAEKDGAYARYDVQGYAKNGVIRARYPGLGEIAVHFEPKKARKLPPRPGCKGPKEVIEQGLFVGTIRFRGEQGFTSVDAARAHGSIAKRPPQVCAPPPRPLRLVAPGTAFEEIELTATSGPRQFTAHQRVGAPASDFSVSTHESRLGMTIYRAIAPVSSKGGFTYHPELTEATVSPPPPFSGSATYAGAPNPANPFPGFGTEGALTGSLQVPLPGLGSIELVDPSAHVTLSRSVGVYDRAG